MGPSTSGGLTSLQILGILENFDVAALEPGSAEAVHLISEASRLAYADRDTYIADPAFVDVPITSMLDKTYLAERAKLIDMSASMGKAEAGTPPQAAAALAPNRSISRPSTTHFSLTDRWGNAVSMTASIEGPFGSHLMAGGFFLNNELTDFSFLPEIDGVPVANAVAPGKRPRSSMSPSMVFDRTGKFYAAIGSPGGSRIITYVTQSLIALLDWEMDMQAAIALPRHVNRNGATELEAGTPLETLEPALQALGHRVLVRELTSGLHGIHKTPQGLEGGADPRREGIVLEGRP
ncbi:gamma-glutamyltransferase family protein [Tepidicaulis marinus]|nr:gamma-glutamyltransferase [Tepidicaulis marinus]